MIDLEAVPEVDAGAMAAVEADLARLRPERLIDWADVVAIARSGEQAA